MPSPPFDITPAILHWIAAIAEKIGEAKGGLLDFPSLHLRKTNRIRTIQASLFVEGNTLTEAQITALVDGKRIVGPAKDIREAANAWEVYQNLNNLDHASPQSFLQAHRILMDQLIDQPGRYRSGEVGIVQGSQVVHLAPPADRVAYLMSELFDYLKTTPDHPLVKSCVFHYEMEFIHPFFDGNGRMGRLWQTLILRSWFPLFEFLPVEVLVSRHQKAYYQALADSDKLGKSTPFLEFMLPLLFQTLEDYLLQSDQPGQVEERLTYYLQSNPDQPFSRKDYLRVFKNLSTATASRDLKTAVEQGVLKKSGDKRNTIYFPAPEQVM